MSNDANLSGYENGRYFSRAWALLTQQKGWWKPVLICAVAMLVPVAGPLAVFGYGLEWARRIAWGSTEGPSRHVKVGELIRSGWRGFVAAIGWAILVAIIGRVLDNVPGLGGLLSFAWAVFGVFLEMLILVAAVRATIYQQFVAGYRAKTLWQMGANDPWGLVRIWLIRLVAIMAMVLLSLFILIPALFEAAPRLYNLVDYAYSMSYYMTDAEAFEVALEIISYAVTSLGSALIAIIAIDLVISSFIHLIVCCGLGLWLRQFDVPAWGKDEDPLPEGALKPRAEKVTAPVNPVYPVNPAQPADPVAPVAVEPEAAAEAPAPEPARAVEDAAPVVDAAPAEPAAAEGEGPAAPAEPKPAQVAAAIDPAASAAPEQQVCTPVGEQPEEGSPEEAVANPVTDEVAESAQAPAAEDDTPADDEPPVPGEDNADEDQSEEVIAVEPIAVAPIDVLGASSQDEPPAGENAPSA